MNRTSVLASSSAAGSCSGSESTRRSSWRTGVVVGFGFVAAAAAAWHHDSKDTVSQAVGAFAIIAVGCAAVNTVNQPLHHPLLSDAAGMITGALVTAAAVVVTALLIAGRGR